MKISVPRCLDALYEGIFHIFEFRKIPLFILNNRRRAVLTQIWVCNASSGECPTVSGRYGNHPTVSIFRNSYMSIFCDYFVLQINDCLLNTTSYGPIHQIPLYRVTDFPLALFAKSLLYIILI